MVKKGGLGKGLDALFIDNSTTQSGSNVTILKLFDIEPNKDQPRRYFDPDALQELSQSIAQHGLLQPIVVRPMGNSYQIIAGERRWRASRLAGLTEIPVIIKDADDHVTMELALIENLQREDLNILEEARGYQTLGQSYGMTQEDIAKQVGKSRPVIANALRLLSLPQAVLELVRTGKISKGHARVLAGIEDSTFAAQLADMVLAQGLSVHQLEKLSKQAKTSAGKKDAKAGMQDNYQKEMQLALTDALARKVTVSPAKRGKGGVLQLQYFSQEDLHSLAKKLTQD